MAFVKYRYISAEQLPVKYGGLSKDGDFGTTDAVIEINVRPAAKHTVEFPVIEVKGSTSLWSSTVVLENQAREELSILDVTVTLKYRILSNNFFSGKIL